MSPDFLSSSPAGIGHPPIDFADHALPRDGPVQEQPETVYSRRTEAPWSGGSGRARCAYLSAVRPHFTACQCMHSSMSYIGCYTGSGAKPFGGPERTYTWLEVGMRVASTR